MQRLIGREIFVPASIGNVGPGFDTLGLAVTLYLRVRIREVRNDRRARLECQHLDGRPVGRDRIGRAFAFGRAARGGPSLVVEVDSRIPQRAGLGSSAAATIAGLRLRDLLDGARTGRDLVSAACALEGHPDNAAAALFGGLTSSSVLAGGRVEVARWPWPKAWRIIVVTPHVQVPTSAARRVLPRNVPLAAAVFNFQRLCRLLAAARDADAGALRDALRDRCHQDYRRPLVPLLREALDLRHPDLLGVCLSGAGPSVMAVARRRTAEVAQELAALYRRGRVPCTVRLLSVHQGNYA